MTVPVLYYKTYFHTGIANVVFQVVLPSHVYKFHFTGIQHAETNRRGKTNFLQCLD